MTRISFLAKWTMTPEKVPRLPHSAIACGHHCGAGAEKGAGPRIFGVSPFRPAFAVGGR